MKLFELQNEIPVPSAEARTLKYFKALLDRDKSKNKKQALKELAFVYFACSFDSRFDSYDTFEETIEAVKTAVNLPEDWEMDDTVRMAIEQYQNSINTESMQLVNKARAAIKKFEEYLENVNLDERTKSNTLVHKAKEYRENVNGVAEMIEKLNQAKILVEKEMVNKMGGNKGKKIVSYINELSEKEPIKGEF